MNASHNADSISYESIRLTAQRYESLVPSQISGLEELRLRDIPEVLNQRRIDGGAFLEKTEVISLVAWKLYVFSPKSHV